MNKDLKDIEEFTFQVLDLIKITCDSCAYNEYYTQEAILNKAIELQQKVIDNLLNI